jgi:hypothetical protein
MNKEKEKRWAWEKLTFGLMVLLYLFSMVNIRFGKDHFKHTVLSDARGYYAYLPAWVVYDDLQFGFQEKIDPLYWEKEQHVNYRIYSNGGFSNKYFAGVALSALPFYLGAHAYVKAVGGVADGFSKPYSLSLSVAACFYALLGLFCLMRLMQLNGVSARVNALSLLVLAFGTQLFYYTISEAGMSHAYSFGWFSLFLWQSWRWLKQSKRVSLLTALFAAGMMVLIRPVNLLPLIFLLPFLLQWAGLGVMDLMNKIKQAGMSLLAGALLFVLPVMVQSWCYYQGMGVFWADSYPGESFDFLHPHGWDILFSFRKGLFIYTPLTLLVFCALWIWWKKQQYGLFFSWMFWMILTTWLFSSWWSWYYGGSFGLRAYIEFYPLFILPFALVWDEIASGRLKQLLMVKVLLLILFCQLQTWQYRHGIIHWDNMDFEQWKGLYYPKVRL